MISPAKVSVQNITFADEMQITDLFSDVGSRVVTVVLSHYMFDILYQVVIRKQNTFRGVLRCESFSFSRCIRIMIDRKSQKNLPIKVFLNIKFILNCYP